MLEAEQNARGQTCRSFIQCHLLLLSVVAFPPPHIVKKTQTEKLSSLSLLACVSASRPLTPPLPHPHRSPSCPVMCSGQTVWLLGVSGMIIETEASKDIPRCLAYPENKPGLFRLGSLLTALTGTVASRTRPCPYRGV